MVDARVEGSSNQSNIQRMTCSYQEEILMLDSDVRVEDQNQIGVCDGGVLVLWKKMSVLIEKEMSVLV